MDNINQSQTIPIDDTGEVARVNLEEVGRPAWLIGLSLDDADAAASYAVDLGVPDGSGGVDWVATDEVTYSSVTEISDTWDQPERYLRVRVTSAASTDDTARLTVSAGVLA